MPFTPALWLICFAKEPILVASSNLYEFENDGLFGSVKFLGSLNGLVTLILLLRCNIYSYTYMYNPKNKRGSI